MRNGEMIGTVIVPVERVTEVIAILGVAFYQKALREKVDIVEKTDAMMSRTKNHSNNVFKVNVSADLLALDLSASTICDIYMT